MTSNISYQDSLSGGANNVRHRGRPRKTVGRKRRGKSLGRYPFLAAANKYLERRTGILADTTIAEMERKFRYIDRVLGELKSEGRISSASPEIMTREDVQAFLIWMKERGLDPDAQNKYLRFIDKVTAFCKNPVIQRIRDEGERLPVGTPKDLVALSEDDVAKIQEAANAIRGWKGEVVRFLVWFYPYTGLRPSELRRAMVEDVDTHNWTFFVRHPKGENRYAKKRTVMILQPAREPTLRFLKARKDYLLRRRFQTDGPLVPSIHEGRVKAYSSNAFRVMKAEVQKIAGIEFSLKDFRPTFTQMMLDLDPTLLSDVSKVLGHSTTRTTERHYGRIRDEKALQRLEKAWENTHEKERYHDKRCHGGYLIESKYIITGYA
jgi:integrase